MLTRLSRALLRVFPAILLVVVGLLAALFRRRRGPGSSATVLAAAPVRQAVPPVRRRGTAIAVLCLLLGIGLILAVLEGDGTLGRLVSPPPTSDGAGGRPLAQLSRGDVGSDRRKASETVAPGGSGDHGIATPPATPDGIAPTFDTVRVEPNGDLVVAGRATPNAIVDLLVAGKPTARVIADANGQFAIVPPALPAGNSEVGLRVTDGTGSVRPSRDSVAVAVSPTRDAKPLVALTSPDKPTRVLSQPGPPPTPSPSVAEAASPRGRVPGRGSPTEAGSVAVAPSDGASNAVAARGSSGTGNGGSAGAGGSDDAKPAAGPTTPRFGSTDAPGVPPSRGAVAEAAEPAPTKIVSVDSQDGGRLFVTGQAAAGAVVRLYLNDTLIAPAKVGRDGTVTFTIGRGVKPGDYKVRLDQVDAASGKVRSRVEVPFSVPEVARIARTDRSIAAPSETAPNADSGGTVGSSGSQPMASSPATVPGVGQTAGASERPLGSTAGSPTASSETPRDPSRPGANPAAVFVPEVKTARIERGDSLWAISRRTYGEGDRYTAIYDANQDQIRDPDLIYPGQVFVLPNEEAIDAVPDEKRG